MASTEADNDRAGGRGSAKQLSPSRVGRYFHLECLRFLRYSATPSHLRAAEGVPKEPWVQRPVMRAVLEGGYAWEERALQDHMGDAVEIAPPPPDKPRTPKRDRAHSIEATIALLGSTAPGRSIYQGSLRAPAAFYEHYGLDPAVVNLTDCRPDLIDVRRATVHDRERGHTPGARLLRISDLKVSRGVKLSHRVQAAFYTQLLRAIVAEHRIDAEVEDDPAIWLVDAPAPVTFDIRAIAPPLEQFLRTEAGPLMQAPAAQAAWHFNPRCETCPYYEGCRDEAAATSDVSLVPGLSSYAKTYLMQLDPPVRTVDDLDRLLADPVRAGALNLVGSLKGRTQVLARQVRAMREERVVPHGGASLAIPIGENVRIVFTIQTEPVHGHVYGWALSVRGVGDILGTKTVTVSDVAVTPAVAEIRRVERHLVTELHRILAAVHAWNEQHAEWKDQKSLQAFSFDTYEEALLTGVLTRGLQDPEIAQQALAVFFHFQRPELMEASDHPAGEVAIPVAVVVRAVRQLLALPVSTTYRFADVARLLAKDEGSFGYTPHPHWDYEQSNQQRPDAVFALWEQGSIEGADKIAKNLQMRVWATGSLIDGLREKLGELAPNALFAWAPKFRLPGAMDFTHEVLSRLAFITRYEDTLNGLEKRQARMAPLAERLANGTTVELVHERDDLFRVASPELEPDFGEGSFAKWILTPATEDGERAALAYPDHQFRDRMYPPAKLPIALAGVRQQIADADGRVTGVRLNLSAAAAFPPLAPGRRYHLAERHTDWNSSRVVGELAQVDRDPDARFVSLLTSEAARTTSRPLRADVRERAMDLARQYAMTTSQLAAYEHVLDFGTTLAWGPPGTGKTHFTALAILCLVEAHRACGLPYTVLVTAFTHAAIDNCLRKCRELQDERGVVRGDVGIAKLDGTKLPGMGRVDDIPKKAGGGYLESGPHVILGGTVYGIWGGGIPEGRADLVVIDEGSQLKVPESVIPIRRLSPAGRLLVAGDHLQLPPIVKGAYPDPEETLAAGLEPGPVLHRSIFEILRGPSDESPVMRSLLENFRMNGVLCRYPASQIYDARYDSFNDEIRHRRLRLKDGPGGGLDGVLVDPDYPLVIVEYAGHRATNENRLEATITANLAIRLRERLIDPRGRGPGGTRGAADAGTYTDDARFWEHGLFIVSPHHAHIGAIRRELLRRRTWTKVPFVDTVDKMQGQECDAVIASYGVADVETALVEQAFIYSLNRLNVSITRGRAKTVVLLSRELTHPPVAAFASEANAAGIAFMQGLVQFAGEQGEVRRFRWQEDGTLLRVLRVRAG